MPTYYHIRVQGHLDAVWEEWFDGMTISNEPNGEAVLAGPMVDQAALYGVLLKIRDLGLPLIAAQPGGRFTSTATSPRAPTIGPADPMNSGV